MSEFRFEKVSFDITQAEIKDSTLFLQWSTSNVDIEWKQLFGNIVKFVQNLYFHTQKCVWREKKKKTD